jgi:hypothetical protein
MRLFKQKETTQEQLLVVGKSPRKVPVREGRLYIDTIRKGCDSSTRLRLLIRGDFHLGAGVLEV